MWHGTRCWRNSCLMIREERRGHITEGLLAHEEDFGFDSEWDGRHWKVQRKRRRDLILTSSLILSRGSVGLVMGQFQVITRYRATYSGRSFWGTDFDILIGCAYTVTSRSVHLLLVWGLMGFPFSWPLLYHWSPELNFILPILSFIPLSLKPAFFFSVPHHHSLL